MRTVTLVVLGLQLAWSLVVLARFDPANSAMQLQESLPWVESLGLEYKLGVDGLSLPLVLINAALTLVSAICTRDIDKDWDLQETGWRMRLDGDTPLDVRISFPIAIEQYTAVMPGLTAHRALNAVPAVCAAPPGIRTTVDTMPASVFFGRAFILCCCW